MSASELPSPSSDQLAQLNNFRDAAALLFQQGKYKEAIEYATYAVQLSRQLFGDGDAAVAEDFGVLGLVYKVAGNWDQAEDCYRYAIGILKQARGDDAIELATLL